MSLQEPTEKPSGATTFTERHLPIPSGLVPAFILGLGALLFHSGANTGVLPRPLLIGLSAALLYLTSVFLDRRVLLIALTIYAISFPLLPNETFETARILMFSLALAGFTRAKPNVPPFLVLFALWLIYLIIITTIPELIDIGSVASVIPASFADLIIGVTVETFAILIIGMLLFSRAVNDLFGRRIQPVSSDVFFVHVVTFTVTFCTACLAAALIRVTGQPFGDAVNLLLERPLATLTLACGMMVIPSLIGFSLSRGLKDFLLLITATAEKDHPLILPKSRLLPLAELIAVVREVELLFSKQSAQLRRSQDDARELRLQARAEEEQIAERELQAKNLVKLMNSAPWGMLACSANGYIIAANVVLGELLNLEIHDLQGKHFTHVESKHPWWKEISALLLASSKEFQKLLWHEPQTQYSSTVDQRYLELVLQVTPSTEITVNEYVNLEAVSSADTALLLFARPVPDLREFQLQLFNPSGLEVLGGQAAEFQKQLKGQLSSVVGNISIITGILSELRDGSGAPFEQTDVGLEISDALRDIGAVARGAVEDLQNIEEHHLADTSDAVTLNVGETLRDLLHYFFGLLREGTIPALNVVPEFAGTPDPNSASKPGSKQPGQIHISINPNEGAKFFAYLLAFLKAIKPKAREISLSVGYEKISSDMIHIIPGSLAGQYARIVLHHHGQSLTANMMTGKLHRLKGSQNPQAFIELTLALLHLQVGRLGGFISIQSTAVKGTTVTIYLPVKAGAQLSLAQRPHRSQKHFMRKRFSDTQNTGREALLVTSDAHGGVTTATAMLRHLGYNVKTRRPEHLSEELSSSVEFSGSGFNPTIGSDDVLVGDGESSSLENSIGEVDLLLVDVETANPASITIIHQFERQYPDAAILLLIDSQEKAQSLFSDWAILSKPYDVEQLKLAIKEAISRA